MLREASFTAVFLLWACAPVRAQQAATAPVSALQPSTAAVSAPQLAAAAGSAGAPLGFEPREKATVGTQDYFSNESELKIDLPQDFNLKVNYSFYKSDVASRTATVYLGGGKDWERASLSFTYSNTPFANLYRAHAFDFYGSINSRSNDFRTTASLDFDISYFDQVIPIRGQHEREFKVKQTMPTLDIRQQIRATELSASYGKAAYDQEIARIANRISPTSSRFSGLLGLLQGFPDMTWKIGVYHELAGAPFRLKSEYTHTRLLIAAQSGHGNSDSYLFGSDIHLGSAAAASLEYTHLTQTGQPQSNYYAAELRLKL